MRKRQQCLAIISMACASADLRSVRSLRLSPRAYPPDWARRSIARKIVPSLKVRGALVQMGPHRVDRARWDWDEIDRNPFFCPDAKTAAMLGDYLDGLRKRGSSIGAVIEVVAEGVPAGLGAPIDRAQDRAQPEGARRAGANGTSSRRSRALGLGRN